MVAGAGADIWDTSDAFQYLFQSIRGGAGGIMARVDAERNTGPYAKAGIMIRAGFEPDDVHSVLDVKPDGGIEFMTRSSKGGHTTYIAGAQARVPVWLRLTANEGTITASFSMDGTAWSVLGSTPQRATDFAGLAVTSHDASALNNALFSNVSVTNSRDRLALPAPWSQQDVGAVSQAGHASFAAGAFTIRGGGSDIWGVADAFHYVSQTLLDDASIVARVDGVGRTNPYAKAGVMIREGLQAGARHVILDVKPDGGLELMTRAFEDGPTAFIAGGTVSLPVWLKLARAGTTVVGSTSPDGARWEEIGSVILDRSASGEATGPAPYFVGLAVTSHSVGGLNTSTFDDVTVSAGAATASPGDIVIDARDVPSASIHGSWLTGSDPSSPGGVRLATPDAGFAAAATPLDAPTHYVDVTFDADAATPYTVWLRLQALGNDKFNDSVWVQFSDALVDGAPADRIGTPSALLVNLASNVAASSLNGWGWVNGAYWLAQPATFTFAQTGQHQLRIQVREDGVAFDQIVLSPAAYLNPHASCPTSCGGAPGPFTNDRTIVPHP